MREGTPADIPSRCAHGPFAASGARRGPGTAAAGPASDPQAPRPRATLGSGASATAARASPPASVGGVWGPVDRAGTLPGGPRGSGLGLAISRGFTEANAGSLHVESLPGQGATFVFEFALQRDAGTPADPGEDGGGERRLQA